MNALVQQKTNLPATDLRAKVMARIAEGTAPVTRDGGSRVYIRFSGNDGTLTIGKDKTDITEGQMFLVAAGLCKHGVMEWVDKKPSDQKRLVNFVDGAAPHAPVGSLMKGDNPKKALDGWADVIILEMVGRGGDFDGINAEFALHAEAAREAGKKVVKAMFDRLADNETHFNACVVLKVGSYENKNYSKTIYFPIFEIVGWASDDDVIMLADEDDNDPLA